MFKAILKGSLQLCLSNFDDLIKAAGAWTVVMVIFGIVVQMAGFGDQRVITLMMTEKPGQFVVYILASFILSAVASSSIAVAWHRFALLGERPATIHLRFGRPEYRYFLYSLLLALFMIVIMTAISLVGSIFAGLLTGFSMGQTGAWSLIVFIVIGLFFTAPILARAGLMLPAAAVDRPMGLFRALKFGRGFGWPMVFATIVLLIPFILLDVAIAFLMTSIGAGLPQLLITLQLVLLKGLEQIIVTILLLSVMTIAYAFARDREAAEPEGPAA